LFIVARGEEAKKKKAFYNRAVVLMASHVGLRYPVVAVEGGRLGHINVLTSHLSP
jgi:hypothetical protein